MTKARFLFILSVLLSFSGKTQEIWFFSEGTTTSYYDQGLVDVVNLGNSYFECTYPPGFPQYSDKVPCSTNAFRGSSSLRFNYSSSETGNWKASIFRSGWTTADIHNMDSLSFYAWSATEVPAAALPLIGLKTIKKEGSDEISSALYKLSDYNGPIPAATWSRLTFPIAQFTGDAANSGLDFTRAKAVVFNQSEKNNSSRTILIDEIQAFTSLQEVPVVTGLTGNGYDSHAELRWTNPLPDLMVRVYASFNNGTTYTLRGETTEDYYLDFVPAEGRNSTVKYRVVNVAGGKESQPAETTASLRDFSDDGLLDMMQQYTFRYFWEGAHQGSGMALERSNGSGTTVASGATGMGLMAMIAAHEREYRPRGEIKDRIVQILNFLETCDRHHGAWSHWYNGGTGRTQPFSTNDDGGDLVETSFVAQALIALKNYFTDNDAKSVKIREKADLLWKAIDWDWYRQGGQNQLYWHWSPNQGFKINMKVSGWNECLVTYLMAASSTTHGIPKEVYTQGWARNGAMVRKRTYYDREINLSPDWGGPLFWIHYTHLGINPHGLKDAYADYWLEHVNTVKIHHFYAVDNPKGWKNYGDKCWGLTASDDPYGYTAHQPVHNDNGTISPTAALASFPYAPEEAMKALKYFYRERGKDLFGLYGPYDAFNDSLGWVKKAYLGIDQGPIMVMIENYRSGLLWNSVMKDSDVQAGLDKLGFDYTISTHVSLPGTPASLNIFPNPSSGKVSIQLPSMASSADLSLFSPEGHLLLKREVFLASSPEVLDCSGLKAGMYLIRVTSRNHTAQAKLLIQK